MKNRLRELRLKKHYSQIYVQIALEIDQSDISKIELGKRNLTLEQCKRAALFFGTSMDYIVLLTDELRPHLRSKSPFVPEYLTNRRKEMLELRVKKYTQVEISKLTGIDQSDYSKIENEKRFMTLTQCMRIAIALETSMDYLVGLTDEKKPYTRSETI